LEVEVSMIVFGIALAGLAPLSVIQMKQIRTLQARIEPDTRYYLVPASDAWARRLGAAATRTTTLPATANYPTQAYINFQQPTDPAPGSFGGKTYRADVGRAFGDRGGGYFYGWNGDNTANTRNRDLPLSPDERYDTLNHMQKNGSYRWEIAVPNGIYRVRIVAGDAGYLDSVYVLTVEGMPLAVGVPILNLRWVDATGVVAVLDGRLTVSNGPLSANNKICFIEITPAAPLKLLDVVSVQKSLDSEEITATINVLPSL
jgi:hypothetical protein